MVESTRSPNAASSTESIAVDVLAGPDALAGARSADWKNIANLAGTSRDPRWLAVVARGLDVEPFFLRATQGASDVGYLSLAYMKSLLFGRFLVSLPYLNSAGLIAGDGAVASALIDEAARLAERLDVRYLELRHEREIPHPRLGDKLVTKVHMRLPLPNSADALWKSFDPKVRNQIRKAEKFNFEIRFGRRELLDGFYGVFSRNMRDLGTPVYSRRLFEAILDEFGDEAELCTLADGGRPIAGALLVTQAGRTEVPSASSLREYNTSCANMQMYWQLLTRAIERKSPQFDFGRSSAESNTYRFKKQWGAVAEPAVWQYHVRRGTVGDMRPDNARYQRKIQIWQRLPVVVTRILGPRIVRGIP